MSNTSLPQPERSRTNGASQSVPLETGPTAAMPRPDATPISDDAIAKLAYKKFVARGCAHGHHEEDWAAAKRDLAIVPSDNKAPVTKT